MLKNIDEIGAVPQVLPRAAGFGKQPLYYLLRSGQEGYAWTSGVHLYAELRPVEGLVIAESAEAAQKYLQVIEAYTHAGEVAAKLFGLELLELQNNVLHFYKEGPLDEAIVLDALRFSYVFTKVLYEVLAVELGGEWHGFAICMEHGEAVVVCHGQGANSSAVSLGPCANSPAKRLLYGKTAAGHAEFPGAWAETVVGQRCRDAWFALNLRDRQHLHLFGDYETPERQLREMLQQYQRGRANKSVTSFVLAEANTLIDAGRFTTERPLRMGAYCLRVDLDGFSLLCKNAFQKGEEAVENLARGFLRILQFGGYYEQRHYGVVRLPWAGDCVSFLIPVRGEVQAFRGQRWVDYVSEWQSFAADSPEGRRQQWGSVFAGVGWAAGMTYADSGQCLVAQVPSAGRNFLIAAGAPVAMASAAQNLGKAGEAVIHSSDYDAAFPIVQKLFQKITGSEFWVGKGVSPSKIRAAAIEAGRSENASKIELVEKARTVTLPVPRPYCR